jgi:hypothetical protein
MKLHIRLVVFLIVLSAAGVAVACLYWDHLKQPRQVWLDTVNAVGQLPALLQHSQDLDEQTAAWHRCNAAKREVVQEVIVQRLTLLEAAARFREADAQLPDSFLEVIRLTVPGRSDEERYCRIVIRKVRSLLAVLSRDAEEVVRQLEAEFERLFGCREEPDGGAGR